MLKKIKLTKHIKTFVILSSFLLVFTGMAKAYDISSTNVKLTDNNNSYSVKTDAKTVEELLTQEEISLNDLDKINVSFSETVKDNMEIVIKRAFDVNVSIDGAAPIKVRTNEETVGKVIANLRREHGTEYVLESGSSSFKAEPNMQIKLNSVKEVIETKKESIPFETTVVENSSLEKGTQRVKTEGVCGEKQYEVKTVYVGGKVSSVTNGEEQIVKAPVAKVIEKGTKEPEPEVPSIKTNKGSFQIVKEYSMKATAYTANESLAGPYHGITASGMKAAVGVVAVDPKVIPLGTKLYIEGYGYAIAGDTGGAIKNNRIDLYFNTYRECVNYGVKNNVKVYVLGKQL